MVGWRMMHDGPDLHQEECERGSQCQWYSMPAIDEDN